MNPHLDYVFHFKYLLILQILMLQEKTKNLLKQRMLQLLPMAISNTIVGIISRVP